MQFAIIINIADEGSGQLDFCLKNIRTVHPKVPVKVISDGVADKTYPNICKRYNAHYELGQYLKRAECGGLWWERTLKAGLGCNTDWMLKVDPDSKFWRDFKTDPPFPISGTLENAGTPEEHIQGGCQAIHRNIAKKIIDSGILTDSAIRNQHFYCPNQAYLKTWVPTGYFTTDHSLMWIARQLNIKYGSWPDVGIKWRYVLPNKGLRYSVTHPHKIKQEIGGVPADTTIHAIITCKARLDHLRVTLPRLLAQSNVEVTVVDYSCPQHTAEWVRRAYPDDPRIRVVEVPHQPDFHLNRARNAGARQTPDGWWCFIDADLKVRDGWADAIRKRLRSGYYFVASPLQWGMTGTVVLQSGAYKKVGGYDETYLGWGCDDLDLYMMLRQCGIRPAFWPGNMADIIRHSDEERTRYYSRSKLQSKKISECYLRDKINWTIKNWSLPDRKTKKEIFAAAEADMTSSGEKASPKPVEKPKPAPPPKPVEKPKPTPPPKPVEKPKPTPPPKPVEKPKPAPPPKLNEVPPIMYFPSEELEVEPILPSPTGGPYGKPTLKQQEREHAPGKQEQKLERPAEEREQELERGPAELEQRQQRSFGYQIARRLMDHQAEFIQGGNLMGTISVVNHCSIDLGLPLDRLAALGTKYLQEIVEPLWPGTAAACIPTKVILPKTRAIVLVDTADHNSDQLGYKTLTPDGMPLSRIPVITILRNAGSLTVAFTQALASMQVDPGVEKRATAADGTDYALEASMPVDGKIFELGGYQVADVVSPAWFETFHKIGSTRFNYMGDLLEPFQIALTGLALTHANGVWSEKFGSHPRSEQWALADRRMHRLEQRKERHRVSNLQLHKEYLARARAE